MNSETNILEKINPHYFWDVNMANLDAKLASRLIIERVFNLGNLREMRLVVEFYGKDHVVDVLMNLNYIDPKTLNFIVTFFNIAETKFRCHTRKQLKRQHWSS